MLRRLALPLGVVLLLLAIALVSLRLGYLGRVDGGPLTEPTGFNTADLQANPKRWSVHVQPYEVDGGRIRVTAAAPVLASPGMRIRGPRVNRVELESYRARRWPPRGVLGPVVGARLRGRGGLAFGVKVRRPGTYFLWRFGFDYEQGARSYRRVTTGEPLCVARRSVCPERPRKPDADAHPLADIGGPSRYPSRLREGEFLGDPPQARVVARAGTVVIRVPLTNLTDHRMEVRDVQLLPVRFGAYTLRSGAGVSFSLAAGASRVVTLRLRGTGCQARDEGTSWTDDGLTARIDGNVRSVPLMAELTPVAAESC